MMKSQLEESLEIYTTGAYLKPLKSFDDLGNELWVWCVSNFDADSFKNGQSINSVEKSNKKDGLILNKGNS